MEKNNGTNVTLQDCIDISGKVIPHGFLFSPGPDDCLVCTCFNGDAILCRSVLCAPPKNCQSQRIGKSCCEFYCLDDLPENDNPHSTELGLRLVASGVTAILSMALLFFLIYRLRQRKIRRRNRSEDHAGTDIRMTSVENNGGSRFFWWKDELCETRTAPPSYDDAMFHQRPSLPSLCSSSSSSYGSDAPPYSEIHHDPVVPAPSWPIQQQQQQRPITPRHLPTGAALVMPVSVPPTLHLHHVERPENEEEILRSSPRLGVSSSSSVTTMSLPEGRTRSPTSASSSSEQCYL